MDSTTARNTMPTEGSMGIHEEETVHLKQQMKCTPSLIARELWQDGGNVPGDIDHEDLDNVPRRITKTRLDEIPTMAEMARAIAGVKDGKNHLGEMEFLLKYGSTEGTICSADCTN